MLAIFFASFCVVEWVMMGLFLKPLERTWASLTRLPIPTKVFSLTDVAALQRPWIVCGTLHINQLLSACWVVLMVYDAGASFSIYYPLSGSEVPAAIFSLIAVQAWRTFRSWGDVPLTRIIYHDGELSDVDLIQISD